MKFRDEVAEQGVEPGLGSTRLRGGIHDRRVDLELLIDVLHRPGADLHDRRVDLEQPIEVLHRPRANLHDRRVALEQAIEVVDRPRADLHDRRVALEQAIEVVDGPRAEIHDKRIVLEKPIEVLHRARAQLHDRGIVVEQPIEVVDRYVVEVRPRRLRHEGVLRRLGEVGIKAFNRPAQDSQPRVSVAQFADRGADSVHRCELHFNIVRNGVGGRDSHQLPFSHMVHHGGNHHINNRSEASLSCKSL